MKRSNPAIHYIGAVTRMEELPKLQASGRPHKAHVTRLIN